MIDKIVFETIKVSDDIVPAVREDQMPAILAEMGFDVTTELVNRSFVHTYRIRPSDLTPVQPEWDENWAVEPSTDE